MEIFLLMFMGMAFLTWEGVMVSMSITFIYSMLMMYHSHQHAQNISYYSSSLSSWLVMLTILIIFLSLLSTPQKKDTNYVVSILFLGGSLVMSFMAHNILCFYVFFETSLIPILYLIICYGYQPERLQAGLYMILYTVFASLPLLVLILMCMIKYSVSSFYYYSITLLSLSGWTYILIMLGFCVKLPIYMFHLWLPKAHVEAPLAGSMILAGVLLKLGGYGLFMFNSVMYVENYFSYSLLVLTCLAVWGSVLSSIMCMRQNDVKAMVAYSSVVHMSIVFLGVTSGTSWGYYSMLLTMVAHGFTSSALFLVAYITYMKTGSRSFSLTSGMLSVYPYLSLFWFILNMVNMSAPPTLNLLGELFIIPAAWLMSVMILLSMLIMMFMSVVYNMYMYTSVNHGKFNGYTIPSGVLTNNNYLSLMSHLFPLMFIMKLTLFL
uniref:NADH dehydrogenase subunit 4 n=1 Tax=Euglandina singleyana TaxID=169637 RepID=UPI002551FD85|nr:NADH dehydrogenase subunit 4 [Euglandina singleyana]WFQ82722.1 NADH dehydrogenase subunit 4 [Euglandina singleyana]